jgi:hypothetical protein
MLALTYVRRLKMLLEGLWNVTPNLVQSKKEAICEANKVSTGPNEVSVWLSTQHGALKASRFGCVPSDLPLK